MHIAPLVAPLSLDDMVSVTTAIDSVVMQAAKDRQPLSSGMVAVRLASEAVKLSITKPGLFSASFPLMRSAALAPWREKLLAPLRNGDSPEMAGVEQKCAGATRALQSFVATSSLFSGLFDAVFPENERLANFFSSPKPNGNKWTIDLRNFPTSKNQSLHFVGSTLLDTVPTLSGNYDVNSIFDETVGSRYGRECSSQLFTLLKRNGVATTDLLVQALIGALAVESAQLRMAQLTEAFLVVVRSRSKNDFAPTPISGATFAEREIQYFLPALGRLIAAEEALANLNKRIVTPDSFTLKAIVALLIVPPSIFNCFGKRSVPFRIEGSFKDRTCQAYLQKDWDSVYKILAEVQIAFPGAISRDAFPQEPFFRNRYFKTTYPFVAEKLRLCIATDAANAADLTLPKGADKDDSFKAELNELRQAAQFLVSPDRFCRAVDQVLVALGEQLNSAQPALPSAPGSTANVDAERWRDRRGERYENRNTGETYRVLGIFKSPAAKQMQVLLDLGESGKAIGASELSVLLDKGILRKLETPSDEKDKVKAIPGDGIIERAAALTFLEQVKGRKFVRPDGAQVSIQAHGNASDPTSTISKMSVRHPQETRGKQVSRSALWVYAMANSIWTQHDQKRADYSI